MDNPDPPAAKSRRPRLPSDAAELISPKPSIACLAAAAAAAVLVLLWQSLTVHYNYSGNWTALFHTGDTYAVPPELLACTYILPKQTATTGCGTATSRRIRSFAADWRNSLMSLASVTAESWSRGWHTCWGPAARSGLMAPILRLSGFLWLWASIGAAGTFVCMGAARPGDCCFFWRPLR